MHIGTFTFLNEASTFVSFIIGFLSHNLEWQEVLVVEFQRLFVRK